MEAPVIECCEEDEQFHDCMEAVTPVKVKEADSADPVGQIQTTVADPCPISREITEDVPDMSTGEPKAELDGGCEAADHERDSEEEPLTGAVEEAEIDENALLELEKDQTEEEREERRKQSTSLKEEGNQLFKKGDYAEAEALYSKALGSCPAFHHKDRSILFSNRAAARMKQDKNDDALKDCTKAIELNPDYIRALLRRAELYEKTDKLDEALADYKSVLEKDPSTHQAREACMRLPRQIEERNEKLKEEMISKLKDLGNLVLRPFGLSTENFQVNQDSTSGSYSINFVQNPNNNR
ncbi:tetratricopeptide repeat protein 1 [Rhinophrynus dorsalis]